MPDGIGTEFDGNGHEIITRRRWRQQAFQPAP
jgi:hypothetical protein